MVTAVIEPGNVPAIYGAMQGVMKGIANIPKNGEMKFGGTNYKYLKADDVQDKLNPLLTENNIVVNSTYEVTESERGNRNYVFVHLTIMYISSIDGTAFPDVKAVGEAIAGDDKSINKALTQAIKNAHRATFQFASGEPEPDGSESRAAVSPTQNKLDKARKPAAKKPVVKATDASGSSFRDRVRVEWIESGKVDKKAVNDIMERVKLEDESKSGDDIFKAVLARLEAGEVG